MVKLLLSETIQPIEYDIGERSMSVAAFFDELRTQLVRQEYPHLDIFDNVHNSLQNQTRVAFVDGFQTRIGALNTVTNSSQIFTQGKGDQGY